MSNLVLLNILFLLFLVSLVCHYGGDNPPWCGKYQKQNNYINIITDGKNATIPITLFLRNFSRDLLRLK